MAKANDQTPTSFGRLPYFELPVPSNQDSEAKATLVVKNELKYQLKKSGYTPQAIKAMSAYSQLLRKNIRGTSALGNLNEILNLTRLYKKLSNIDQILPNLLRQSIIADNVSGEDSIDQTAFAMAQVGKVNTKELAALYHTIALTKLATNGAIDENIFYARAVAAKLDVGSQITSADSGEMVAAMLAMMKSGAVAPALTAIGQAFKPKNLTPNQRAALNKIGIIAGEKNYNQSPAAWFNTTLLTGMDNKGYNTSRKQQAFLNEVLKNNKYAKPLKPLLNQMPRIDDFLSQYNQEAKNPVNQFNNIVEDDPILRDNAVGSAAQSAWLMTPKFVANVVGKTSDAVLNFKVNHPVEALMAEGIGGAPLLHMASQKVGNKISPYAKDMVKIGANKSWNLLKNAYKFSRSAKIKVKLPEAIFEAEGAEAIEAGFLTVPVDALVISLLPLIVAGAFAYAYRKKIKKNIGKWIVNNPPGGYAGVLNSSAHSHSGFSRVVPPKHVEQRRKDIEHEVSLPHNSITKSMAQKLQVQTGPTGFDYTFSLTLPSGTY